MPPSSCKQSIRSNAHVRAQVRGLRGVPACHLKGAADADMRKCTCRRTFTSYLQHTCSHLGALLRNGLHSPCACMRWLPPCAPAALIMDGPMHPNRGLLAHLPVHLHALGTLIPAGTIAAAAASIAIAPCTAEHISHT